MGPVESLPRVASIDNEAPAGGIHASASDMTRWIQMQLDRGRLGDGRLFSEATGREMWTSQTLIPIEPTEPSLALTTSNFNTYGFGWVIRDYRGHKIVMHEGLQEGAISATILIPERHVGFIVMLNSEDGEARWAVCYHLLDHYLQLPPTDWIAAYTAARAQSWKEALRILDSTSAQPTPGSPTAPSLPLARYAGVYKDPWYGTVTVTADAATLAISFDHTPSMHGALEHVRGDTFRTRFSSRGLEDAYMTFKLNAGHSVASATLRPVSPLADFSFDFADLSLTPAGLGERQ
jgi:CubicO group peptidase (beta-lactamase class C family)